MKMLTLKTTTIALMSALLSTNVYAMDNDDNLVLCHNLILG